MSELNQYIQSYFGIVNQEQLDSVSSFFSLSHAQKGDFIFKKGNNCDKLLFLKSGLLRIYEQTEDKEITQWISSKGYFVTDLSSFVFNKPSRWNIVALTDVEMYVIQRKDYLKLSLKVPQWHELEKMFIIKCFITLEERIYSHLSMTDEERYSLFFESNKELFNQVPLQYIASMLGMTPETFSRIRKKHLLNFS